MRRKKKLEIFAGKKIAFYHVPVIAEKKRALAITRILKLSFIPHILFL
jgi:hypothetical protein